MLGRIGDALLVLGLVVGAGAVVGYQLDIIPNLPPAILKLVLYKLTFVGGLGLLVAGAFVRRAANRESERAGKSPDALPPPDAAGDFTSNAWKREKQEAPSAGQTRSRDVL